MPGPTQTGPADAGSGHTVLDARDISRALTRISHELLKRNKGPEDLILLGLHTRGVPLARRIGERIAAVAGTPVAVGSPAVPVYHGDRKSDVECKSGAGRVDLEGRGGQTTN